MELKQAIKILEDYQAWRLGSEKYFKHSPNSLTIALEIVVKVAKSV